MVCFKEVKMDTSGGYKSSGSSTYVVAGSSLPHGAYCGPIPEIDVTSLDFRDDSETEMIDIQVVSCDGRLMSQKLDSDWIQYLRASRDIFEQNLELYESREGHVCIRTTRAVCKGEQLTVWFEEAYGRQMNVPYLTLYNIKGIQTYVCSHCEKIFSYPNQLKLHMMRRHCDRTSRDIDSTHYWSAPKEDPTHNKCEHFKHERQLFSSDNTHNLAPSFSDFIRLNLKTSAVDSFDIPYGSNIYKTKTRHVQRVSPLASINCHVTYNAPKHIYNPYQLEARVNIIPSHRQQKEDFKRNYSTYKHLSDSIEKRPCKTERVTQESDEEPIDMLHKSFIEFSTKSGHRCVYCGKFYSRKYGLKIHLRTHTGYKPLKCKVCLRAFGDPSNLNKHIRLHSECDTPYKCPYCGKLLVRRRDLVRHLNSRHPDKVQHDSKIKVF